MATRDRETGAAMSDKELIDEVLTLIVAGHETTAAALTWTWYLISQHPDTARAPADRSRPHRAPIRPWVWTPPKAWSSRIRCCRKPCGCIRRVG